MRILLATGLFPPESGGPATYAKLLSEQLPARGIEVDVLPFSTVRQMSKLWRHGAYLIACVRRGQRADVLYALDTVSVGAPAALAALVLRKKLIVRVPGDYAWEQARQRFGVTDELDEFQTNRYGWRVEWMRRVQRFVVRRAVRVIVPSEYMRRIVERWGAQPIVIYSSIDVSAAYVLPAKRPSGFLVVSSGRKVPWKGFDGIERVVAREKEWHFFLASELPHTEALGWVKTADVFVLNSTYEGLSHALVEAMALGTPIIATAVGGNGEVVGDAGILIPPQDDEALYLALQEVHNNPVAAAERAARGLARVKQFSIDVALGKLTELFATL